MQVQVPNQTNQPIFISSTNSSTSSSNREKPSQRSLEARRAIEDYFENKRLNHLIGDDYWEDD
ncbi:hypothetical protein H0A36_13360 [Endozoicomonas sp. SM1973]|uniref:Uncharacterized protein n=1 Tax=Spartinivicinus marinus TaxID=2994442 RepID=A0A853I5W5_9GAMM|nr:hypothetical protein [Spartinivicinus marinus]MCX4027006.1 hypothetical protein [Spartinivicinus marinus]NYZ67002.1 hypothetical protein [Spartinivicinus marinus]